jgi:hypothetical protein
VDRDWRIVLQFAFGSMAKVLVLRETERTVEDLAERLDHYFRQADETLRPFLDVTTCSWNARRSRATIRAGRVHAEVVIMPGRVLVIADLPVIWLPLKGRIEERIARALEHIVGTDQPGRTACS